MSDHEVARLADELLLEYAHRSPTYLADELERSAAVFDEGPRVAALIVEELRDRSRLGVRFRGTVAEATAPTPSNDLG